MFMQLSPGGIMKQYVDSGGKFKHLMREKLK
jgi:hypothetical protein